MFVRRRAVASCAAEDIRPSKHVLAQIVKIIDHVDKWVIKPRGGAHVHAETPTRRHVSKVGVSACGKDTKLLVKMGVARAQEVCSTFRKNVMSSVKYFRDLDVYQGAMSLVMRIFELTKHFPIEEKYTLTDQVRRSSRSVCANLAGAWRKRRYEGAFVSKLSDAEAEAAETQVHIACRRIGVSAWRRGGVVGGLAKWQRAGVQNLPISVGKETNLRSAQTRVASYAVSIVHFKIML